ncbi:MAG: hypothetical protein HDQ96_05465 [Lachnospiraceae bacterium]|nr:hypothetical protein [Lachnospiraceae bacterium]
MDGGSCNGLSAQGILEGTEYESYKAFEDEPSYEAYIPTWLKVIVGAAAAVLLGVTAMQLGLAAGAVTAGVGIVAAVTTGIRDSRNGVLSGYLYQ